MIQGAVNAKQEALVRLRLRGPSGLELDVNTIIDTGFDAELVLSVATVLALGLVKCATGTARLADGSTRSFDVFRVEVFWDGNWRACEVYDLGSSALLGMRMLSGHRLLVDVEPGGLVEIIARP
jgi:clan AA aspartic protease